MKTLKIILAGVILQTALVVGVSGQGHMHETEAKSASPQKAICILYPTQGNKAFGTITFTRVDGGIKIVADLEGLSKGKHGFHIHDFGDCSSPDGSSAGGHFNPEGKSHGAPMEMTRHIGDLGNLDADESGVAHLEYLDKMLQLEGDHSIIGRSVIVHASEDDLKSQPTGNSGPRIACGVIGIAK
ncbi:MAG: superoxide dismutase family protein [bacterium]